MTARFEDTIQMVCRAIYDSRLHEAMTLLQPIYQGHPSLVGREEFERIGKDYAMMRDFLLRGFADPQREQLYDRLLHELYRIASNLKLSWRCKNVEAYAIAYQTDNQLNRSHDFLKTVLERYVSDEALLSLKDDNQKEAASSDLHKRHQTFIERLFCAIFLSLQWTEADQQFYEALLLSPLVDRHDTLLMLSALTLAVMNNYDERKWITLARVYQGATDEQLRQRALVGWALTSHSEISFFVQQQKELQNMMADSTTKAELLELQKQIFYCMNAEKDNAMIRKDIIPNMMKGSNLRMGKFGIEEKAEGELNGILHPNADEEAMEKVERSIDKMREMEKKGADIYFGGFAQMKRFPFFRVLSNWFAPFRANHPGLADAQQKLGDGKMLQALLAQHSMCSSDKYSLVLAMGQVIDRIPENLRDAMRTAGGWDSSTHTEHDALSSTYIRRMYLQNLYRFFRLWPQRTQIQGAFTDQKDDSAFFLITPLFDNTDSVAMKIEMGQFLLRHGMYERLRLLLNTIKEERGEQLDFLRGCLCLHDDNYSLALEKFQLLLTHGHESMALLRATAKAAMASGNYSLASQCFGKLETLDPDNIRTRLNACLAAQKAGKFKSTLNSLYELYYNFPDNLTVQRVLAWSLLNGDNPAKAIPIYNKLLAAKPETEDYVNAGYAHWITGHVKDAHDLFCHYPDRSRILDEFIKDREVLQRNGITQTDTFLMADAIKEGC